MPKKLKIWNGRDWASRGGHLWVAAYSVAEAVRLVNEAYRKVHGYEDRPDISVCSAGEVGKYWNKGCWGTPMAGIEPERGVWWGKADGRGMSSKPVRLI